MFFFYLPLFGRTLIIRNHWALCFVNDKRSCYWDEVKEKVPLIRVDQLFVPSWHETRRNFLKLRVSQDLPIENHWGESTFQLCYLKAEYRVALFTFSCRQLLTLAAVFVCTDGAPVLHCRCCCRCWRATCTRWSWTPCLANWPTVPPCGTRTTLQSRWWWPAPVTLVLIRKEYTSQVCEKGEGLINWLWKHQLWLSVRWLLVVTFFFFSSHHVKTPSPF